MSKLTFFVLLKKKYQHHFYFGVAVMLLLSFPFFFVSGETVCLFISLTFSLELFGLWRRLPRICFLASLLLDYVGISAHICIPVLVWSELQGETKILKLKNLRPQDYANYSCIASVRNVCGIPDRSVIFRLTNKTGTQQNKISLIYPKSLF